MSLLVRRHDRARHAGPLGQLSLGEASALAGFAKQGTWIHAIQAARVLTTARLDRR